MKFFRSLLILISSLAVVIIFPASTQASINYQPFDIKSYQSPNQLNQSETIKQITLFATNMYHELGKCQGPQTKKILKDVVYCPNIFEADRVRLAYLAYLASIINNEMVEPERQFVKIVTGGDTQLLEGGAVYLPNTNGSPHDDILFKHMIAKILYDTAAAGGVDKYDGDDFWQRVAKLNPDLPDETVIFGQKIGDFKVEQGSVSTDNTIPKADPRLGIFLVSMLSDETNVESILSNDNQLRSRWLPFNDAERAYYYNLKLEKPSETINQYERISSACIFRGVTAMIACAPTRFMANTATGGMKIIGNSLRLKSEIFVKTSKQSGTIILHDAWQWFRNLANVLLILSFILMIFGTITNFRNGAYHAKRLLPRLAIFAVLINLSYFAMTGLADISNITGDSLASLMSKLGGGDYKDILAALVKDVLAGSAVVLLFGSPVLTAVCLIPIVIFVFLSFIAMIVILALRDALFVIIVLTIPLALATLIISSSSKFFTAWSKALMAIILFYPMASALIGAANFVAKIMANGGIITHLLSPVPIVAAYLTLPQILYSFANNLPIIGSKVGSFLQNLPKSARSRYEKTDLHQQNQQVATQRQRQLQRQAIPKFDSSDLRGTLMPVQRARKALRDLSNTAIGRLDASYADYNATLPTIDEKAFEEITKIANDKNLLSENAAQVFIKKLIESDRALAASGDNLASNDLYQNALDPTSQMQVSTYLSSSDENNILAAMISLADNGHGNFDDIRRASQIYINRGGDEQLLMAAYKTMDKMYEKENKQTSSALVRQFYEQIEKHSDVSIQQALRGGSTHFNFVVERTPGPGETRNTVKDELFNTRLNIVKNSFLDRTNWSKFKGYKNDDLDDRAFRDFINDFGSRENRNRQLEKIANSGVVSQDGLNYLNSLRS